MLTYSRAKAETLNRVFAAKAAIEDNGRQPPILETMTEAELHCVNLKSCEVRRLLKSLQVDKATGPDDISALVLRESATELDPSLSRLFRISLHTRRVPAGWKHGHITACHKGGWKDNPENYWPISLLPIVSKSWKQSPTNDSDASSIQTIFYLTPNSALGPTVLHSTWP